MIEVDRTKGPAAQGDCFVIPVDGIPGGYREQERSGRLVVAHSETGHDHAIDDSGCRLFVGSNPMVCYLRAETAVALEHHRPFDTHEALLLPPGDYQILRQREGSPEGWRRVED